MCEALGVLALQWPAIAAIDFRAADVKERKQAEFLVHERFPWDLVVRIGVCSGDIQARVTATLRDATHRPAVEIRRAWEFSSRDGISWW